MNRVKIINHEPIIYNTILFLLLSFMIPSIEFAYRAQVSALTIDFAKKSIEQFYYFLVPATLAIWLIWKQSRYTIHIFYIIYFFILFLILRGLFLNSNKIIIVLLFLYTCLTYFMHLLIKNHLMYACYNPNFYNFDLFEPLCLTIPCKIYNGSNQFDGTLTNWDDYSCFIYQKDPKIIKGKVNLKVYLNNRCFESEGEVVARTTNKNGHGIKLIIKDKIVSNFNWVDFSENISQLGLTPKRLR